MKLIEMLFLLSFIGFNLVLGIFLVGRFFSATVSSILRTKRPAIFESKLQQKFKSDEVY